MLRQSESEATYVFVLAPGAHDPGPLATELQVDFTRADDFARSEVVVDRLGARSGLFLNRLGVLIATASRRHVQELTQKEWFPGLVVSYRETRKGAVTLAQTEDAPVAEFDESTIAWGVQATGAANSAFTGRGVRVAVLDSALDVAHPDFAGRPPTLHSVTGEAADDSLCIHGTAVSGIVAGPKTPVDGPRYGVAPECDLFFARVMSDNCGYEDPAVIAGLEWALANQCRVVNLSLGRGIDTSTEPNDAYDAIFAKAAAQGMLIVAAAGDQSQRQSAVLNPVQEPANAIRAFAVSAVRPDLQVLSSSNAGLTPGGGEVDAVGPGFSIRSAAGKFTPERLYGRFFLTSMATAFVTGVAALWLEKDPGLRPDELFQRLKATAKPCGPAADCGAGLVQAPL